MAGKQQESKEPVNENHVAQFMQVANYLRMC